MNAHSHQQVLTISENVWALLVLHCGQRFIGSAQYFIGELLDGFDVA